MPSKPTLQPATATAPDPAAVEPKQFKVQNEKVHTLPIEYGPHEKSVMDSHPTLVAIILTDCQEVHHVQ
jgi:hypothetical protein